VSEGNASFRERRAPDRTDGVLFPAEERALSLIHRVQISSKNLPPTVSYSVGIGSPFFGRARLPKLETDLLSAPSVEVKN
jgi:hypothetical protein